MRHTYSPVCTLTQQHSYFQAPETASVRLAPTADTADKLRRAGLLLKATESGLVLLRALPVPEADEAPTPPRPLPEFLFPLRFVVQPISPYFWNFTALPEQLAPSQPSQTPVIQYFRAKAGTPGNALTLSMPDAQPLLLTPLALRVKTALPSAVAGPEVIRDAERDKVLAADMVRRNAAGLNFDLRAWGPGHYQLQRNGEALLDCYADDQLHALQAWAVLEIDQAALAAGPLSIRFAFEARRTRWRYLVRYRPSQDSAPATPENASIKVKGPKDDKGKKAQADAPVASVSFASPKKRPTTGPSADLVFESNEALALAERPAYSCTLHYTLNGVPTEVALPAARAEVLCRPAEPATNPPSAAFSEIMVLL